MIWLHAGAVKLNYNLMVIESTAGKIFKVWAGYNLKKKKQAVLDKGL